MPISNSNRTFIVYVLTNQVNGKKYVGKTVKPLAVRWRAHCSSSTHGNQMRICRAIRKYGEHCFTQEVLEICDSEEQAFAQEVVFISRLGTKIPEKGYNSTDGGDGVSGFKRSPETCLKMSLYQKGRPNLKNRGRVQTEHQKNLNRLAHIGKPSAWKGRTASEETRKKQSEASKGRVPWNRGKSPSVAYRQNIIMGATKRADAHLIEVNGNILNAITVGKMNGIAPSTVHNRIARGWSLERAVSEPANPIHRRKTS